MVGGFSDIEIAGNQSMKNSIKFLAEFVYQIQVFTFMPEGYPNLQEPGKVFPANVEFHRLLGILSFIIKLGKKEIYELLLPFWDACHLTFNEV